MFYKTSDSLEGAQREFRRFFNLGRHGQVPSKHAIKTWIKNFEETGSALKKKPTGPTGDVAASNGEPQRQIERLHT
jgi:transposase